MWTCITRVFAYYVNVKEILYLDGYNFVLMRIYGQIAKGSQAQMKWNENRWKWIYH